MPEAYDNPNSKLGSKVVFQADTNVEYKFELMLESLKVFDSEDLRNWQLLALSTTQLIGEMILILFMNLKPDKISDDILKILLLVCEHVSAKKVDLVEDESPDDPHVIDIALKQTQSVWA